MTQQATESDQDIQQARNYLRGERAAPGDILALAKRLKGSKRENGFRWPRRILARARETNAVELANNPDLALKLGWQHSLCTYKDPDLPTLRRLKDALAILQTVDHPDRSTKDETLGQTGAIYKRLWEATGQKLYLEKSYTTIARVIADWVDFVGLPVDERCTHSAVANDHSGRVASGISLRW